MRITLFLMAALAVTLTAWLHVGAQAMREGWRLYDAAAEAEFGSPNPGMPTAATDASRRALQEYGYFLYSNMSPLLSTSRSTEPPPASNAISASPWQ